MLFRSSNANDSGIITERGSTGNNAIFVWDESADSFIVGTTTATASDTGNLSITAAPFAASTISATELSMGDSEKIKLGAGNDLEIFHDGSNSYVKEVGTGGLILAGSNTVTIVNQGLDETMVSCTVDGAVELYHNNSKKIETTSGGATITGTLIISALPTSDPTTAGALYNDSGVVKVSAG